MTFHLPARTGSASEPTPLLTYTLPHYPLPMGEKGELQITISDGGKDSIACQWIEIRIGLGSGIEDLFFGYTPTLSCDSEGWQTRLSNSKRSPVQKDDDSLWCTVRLTNLSSDWTIGKPVTITLEGRIVEHPGKAKLELTENSKRGSEEYAEKAGHLFVGRDIAGLYLRNVRATATTTDSQGIRTQFQENESIRLIWETNGHTTSIYLPDSPSVDVLEREYRINSGLKRDTTIVLCATRANDSGEVYASITLTVIKREPLYLMNLHSVNPSYQNVPYGEFCQGQSIHLKWQTNASMSKLYFGSRLRPIAVVPKSSSNCQEYTLKGGLEQGATFTVVATKEGESNQATCSVYVPVVQVIKGWREPFATVTEFMDKVTGNLDFYFRTIQCADIDGDGRAEILGRNISGLLARRSAGTGQLPVLTAMSNDAGWKDEARYSTIQCADVDGDGIAEVIGRSNDGLHCWKLSSDKKNWETIGQTLSELADEGGWSFPKYYRTIQCADINGDGKAELLARGAGGLRCWQYNNSSKGFEEIECLSALSDGAGWHEQQYYLTIQCADVNGDGKLEVLARGVRGLHCWALEGKSFVEIAEVREFPDSGGWDQEKYYSTIQCADIDGDGKAELLARGAGGVEVWRLQGRSWTASTALEEMSDRNGWDAERFYRTIQCADIDGDGKAEVFGLGPMGPVIYKFLQYPNERWAAIRAPHEFFGDGRIWDLPKTYGTIQFADIDGDGRAELMARDYSGIRSWKALVDSAAQYVPGSEDSLEFGVPYRIKSVGHGTVLDDRGGAVGKSTADLKPDDVHNSLNRNWILMRNDLGFRIKSVGHGTVLDDWGGAVGEAAAALVVDNSPNHPNRTWVLVPNDSGFRIKSVGHGTVLDDWGGKEKAALQVDDAPNSPNRTWTLVRSELAQ